MTKGKNMPNFEAFSRILDEKFAILKEEEDRFKDVNSHFYPNVLTGQLVDEVNSYRLDSINSYNEFTISNTNTLTNILKDITDLLIYGKVVFAKKGLYVNEIKNYYEKASLHEYIINVLTEKQTMTTRFTDREMIKRKKI